MNDAIEKQAGRRRRRIVVVVAVLAVVLGTVGTAVAAGGGSGPAEKADVMNQGGEGVYKSKGAQLIRTDQALEVKWKIKTPEPGSYEYPEEHMVPPGAPDHPPISAGEPEVFTLWLFSFDHPELCSDGQCDGNDLGDTDARGNVYQLDGVIADGNQLRMSGKVKLGEAALNGVGLGNPEGAEVHVAMAPHGTALDGADLVRQLNSSVGGPPFWWAAIFDAP